MQKQKKQIIGIAVALILFIAAFAGMKLYNQKQSDKKAAQEEADKTYITQIKSENVTAFSYQVDDNTLTFSKKGDTWQCDNDPSVVLDQDKIGEIIGHFTSVEAVDKIENPEDLKEYGFDTPENVITFTTSEGTTTLTIGMKNEITNQYYVTTSDNELLYLVSSSFPGYFEQKLEDLEEKQEDTETETQSVETEDSENSETVSLPDTTESDQ